MAGGLLRGQIFYSKQIDSANDSKTLRLYEDSDTHMISYYIMSNKQSTAQQRKVEFDDLFELLQDVVMTTGTLSFLLLAVGTVASQFAVHSLKKHVLDTAASLIFEYRCENPHSLSERIQFFQESLSGCGATMTLNVDRNI